MSVLVACARWASKGISSGAGCDQSRLRRLRMRFANFTRSQWRVLLILMLVNFVNYVDRQIIFSLFPSIRHDFYLTYVQLCYLATAFTVVASLSTFPLGILAGRVFRPPVIGAGVP